VAEKCCFDLTGACGIRCPIPGTAAVEARARVDAVQERGPGRRPEASGGGSAPRTTRARGGRNAATVSSSTYTFVVAPRSNSSKTFEDFDFSSTPRSRRPRSSTSPRAGSSVTGSWTSNRYTEKMHTMFGIRSWRAMDRLLHDATVIEIEGESQRNAHNRARPSSRLESVTRALDATGPMDCPPGLDAARGCVEAAHSTVETACGGPRRPQPRRRDPEGGSGLPTPSRGASPHRIATSARWVGREAARGEPWTPSPPDHICRPRANRSPGP
jgi:hypothetical protein